MIGAFSGPCPSGRGPVFLQGKEWTRACRGAGSGCSALSGLRESSRPGAIPLVQSNRIGLRSHETSESRGVWLTEGLGPGRCCDRRIDSAASKIDSATRQTDSLRREAVQPAAIGSRRLHSLRWRPRMIPESLERYHLWLSQFAEHRFSALR